MISFNKYIAYMQKTKQQTTKITVWAERWTNKSGFHF